MNRYKQNKLQIAECTERKTYIILNIRECMCAHRHTRTQKNQQQNLYIFEFKRRKI